MFDVDNDWSRVVMRREALTWIGDTVTVLRHIVVQSEQHDPHGQGEHPSQETVEHQVEEQDEGCTEKKNRAGERYLQSDPTSTSLLS